MWGQSWRRKDLMMFLESAIVETCQWAVDVGERSLSVEDHNLLRHPPRGKEELDALKKNIVGWDLSLPDMDPMPLLKLGFAEDSKRLLDKWETHIKSPADLISIKEIIQDFAEPKHTG